MSVAFSEASSSRIEGARQSGIANAALQADLTVWGVYLQARAQGDTALATFVEKRFTDHFRVAYQAWIAQGEATAGPFKMKEYVPPGTTEAAAADQYAVRSSRSTTSTSTTRAATITPSSLSCMRWSCSLPRHRPGWGVRTHNGSCSVWRSRSSSQLR